MKQFVAANRTSVSCLLLLLTLLVAGCAVPSPTPADVATPSASTSATGGDTTAAVLTWQGAPLSDATACGQLAIDSTGQVTFGPCGETGQVQSLGAHAQEWTEIQQRFAAFTYTTDGTTLTFNSAGTAAGDAWQRALATWAQLLYSELTAGRTGAAVATALSWFAGEVPGQAGQCQQVMVLVYGYAYAQTVPCTGGDVQASVGGWLNEAEMSQFDQWLYGYTPIYVENNYLAGVGDQAAGAAEIEQINIWAQALYTRLQPGANAVITPEPLPIPAAAEVIESDVQYIQALVNVNIRSGPGTDYGIVGSVAAGQTALVTGVMPDGSWWRVICPDGSRGSCFVVNDPSLTQPTAPPDGNAPISEAGEALVESLEVRILESFPVQVQAVVRGQLPDACVAITGHEAVSAGPTFRIRLTTARQTDRVCAQVVTPFEEVVALDVAGLPAGAYDVRINDLVEPFTLAVDNGAQSADPTGTTATYRDDVAGFSFDYHAPAWTVGDKQQIGPRGSVVPLTFSSHAPDEIGATHLDVAVMAWDPKGDLAAYVAMRKTAWDASGMTIVSEEERFLAGDHPAVRFVVTGADGQSQGYFFMTTVGDQYLVLSGEGNVDALDAIAQTVQITQ